LISISDAGHSPFALLDAVDAIAAKFGESTLVDQGIVVPATFFRKRKDETGWHRDEVLTALQDLDHRLDGQKDHSNQPGNKDRCSVVRGIA
jgi:hypothetical protein